MIRTVIVVVVVVVIDGRRDRGMPVVVPVAERVGELGGRFGTATPREALEAHRVFAAALRSNVSGAAEPLS